MNMAIMADYLTVKKSLGQQVLVGIICGLIIGLACGSVSSLPALIVYITAIGQFISLSALDERDGWESYRSMLPVSRSQIIAGRMVFMAALMIAFLLVGIAVAVLVALASPLFVNISFLSASSITLDVADLTVSSIGSLAVLMAIMGVFFPVVAKYGMTNAVRVLPVAFVLIFVFAFAIAGGSEGALFGSIDAFFSQLPLAVFSTIMIAVGAMFYVVGGILAMRFYAQREF